MKYSIIRTKQFGSRLPKCSSQVSDDFLVISQNLMDTCRKEYSFFPNRQMSNNKHTLQYLFKNVSYE